MSPIPTFLTGEMGKYITSGRCFGVGRDALTKVRDVAPGQRTLFNFDVEDPYDASSIDSFKDQYRRLNGRNPSATELSTYYNKHPQELARRHAGVRKV